MSYELQFVGREINGDSHARFYLPLRGVAEREGWRVILSDGPVIYSAMGPALGLTNFWTREIAVSSKMPLNMQVRVLAHELGHALTGRADMVWPHMADIQKLVWAETIAESVALRVCYGIGLNVLDVSTGYLHTMPPRLVADALVAELPRIHQIADRILREIN